MTIEYEETTGSVFEALGFKDAKQREAKAKLGFQIVDILRERNLKQREIGELLNLKQSEVSKLMNFYFGRFTIDRLLGFLDFLDCPVKIEVAKERTAPFQEIYSSL
jgi:predicted XRE-type DNA-binding protein